MNSDTRQLYSFKNISWYFWDFATQIVFVNASVYFSQWLVVDNKVPDFWFSFAFIGSTIILIFLSPFLGYLVDQSGNRKQIFFSLTLAGIVCGGLIQVAAHLHSFLARIVLTLVLYSMFNILYQLGAFLYNTFLKDISTPRTAAKVAGLGGGLSTIGDVVGLLVTLPIVTGAVYFLGRSRIDVMLPAAILALLFCIPVFVAFRKHKDAPGEVKHYKDVFGSVWRDLKNTEQYPGVTRLLIAFYCFNDAILTLQLFSAIYLDKVYHFTDAQKIPVFMLVYLGFTLGAVVGGYLGDKWGNQRILMLSLGFTALVVIGIALAHAGIIVYVLFGLFGLGTGIAFATAKALFTILIPYEKKAQFFGLYSISERLASIGGPAIWGIVVYLVVTRGALNYRAAVFAMSLFLLLGVFVARKIKEPQHDQVVV